MVVKETLAASFSSKLWVAVSLLEDSSDDKKYLESLALCTVVNLGKGEDTLTCY